MNYKNRLSLALTIAISTLTAGCIDDSESNKKTTYTPVVDTRYLSSIDTTSMEALDKRYIPALFYSNIGNDGLDNVTVPNDAIAASARGAIGTLKSGWQIFTTANSGYANPTIDGYINTAEAAYANATQGTVITDAHPSLEAIRDELSIARSNNGVDYVMDKVTTAHHKMEPVAGAASKHAQDPDALAAALLANNVLAEFKAAWEILVAAYGDGSEVRSGYGLSANKSLLISKLISNADPNEPGILQMLTVLEGLVASRSDDATMVSIATAIKPRFVKMFVSFGDFLDPFKSDMIAMERAYIPALYCSNNPIINNNPDPTCMDGNANSLQGTLDYVAMFQQAFNQFSSHYPILGTSLNMPVVLNWATQLNAINDALASAQAKLQSSKDNGLTLADAKDAGAHDDLEQISGHLFDLRHTYENYPFVFDALTYYHSLFGPLLAVVNDANGAKTSLSQDEVDAIEAQMSELQDAFASMKASVQLIEPADFGMSDLQQLNQLLDTQEQNISTLVMLLAAYNSDKNDNSSEIVLATINVQKTYVPFFRSFGAF